MKHMKKLRILLPLMIVCMMIIGASPVSAASDEFLKSTDTITVKSSEKFTIADGVYEGKLTLSNSLATKAGDINASVILIKPNAKVAFKPVVPNYYTEGSTLLSRAKKAADWTDDSWSGMMTVSQMAAQYNSAKETPGTVLAGINGDFSLGGDAAAGTQWTSAPRGSIIMEGNKIAHSRVPDDEFYFGRKNSGAVNIVQHTTGDQRFQEAICGGAYILRNGQLFGVDNETTIRQRTGIGIKNNGDILLICVENMSKETGISVKQMAELMKASGCWNGINMDGGASTTMITKRAGETTTTRRTGECTRSDAENGERRIPCALMLVTDNGSTAAANKVTTSSGSSIETDKASYKQGDAINVTASSDQEGAWVGVYKDGEKPGDANVSSICWYYTYGANDAGTWCWENGTTYNLFEDAVFNAGKSLSTVGRYTAYVVAADNTTILDSTSFEVTENAAAFFMEMDGKEFNLGDAVNVTAHAPTSDAWVGLYYANEPHDGSVGSLRWFWVSDHNGTPTDIISAKIDLRNEALQPGEYKAVLFGDSGYTNVKSVLNFTMDKKYNITYKHGDEVLENMTPASYSHLSIQKGAVALPQTVDKAGHTFLGWYDNADFTGEAVTAIPQGSTEDKTFYGKFDRHSYAVNFDTDGGSEVAGQTVYYGDLASKPAENPTKGDLYFLGWVTEKGGSVPFDFNKPITGATTAYAKWGAENGVVVEFNSNGGSAVLTQVVAFGEKAEKPANPTRTGYNFDKWVKADGTAFDFATAVTEAMTLKATWTPVTYTITFNANGGSAVANKTYNIETAAFDLPKPTKDGHVFQGWKDAAGKSYTTIAKGTTGNLTLTAQWKALPLSVNKTSFYQGEPINVTANCSNGGSWVGLYRENDKYDPNNGGVGSQRWYDVNSNPGTQNLAASAFDDNGWGGLKAGTYKIVLFGDGGYGNVLEQIIITIAENPNPSKGKLHLSGYTRDDKTYSGESSADHGKTLYEFFYGDGIFVQPEVSGYGVENAWVGVLSDGDYEKGKMNYIGGNWFYLNDFKDQKVNLNYLMETTDADGALCGVLSEQATSIPFGLNYWIVLVSDHGEILDAAPFNYRTFNMDWYGQVWADAASKRIKIVTEWTSKLANGTTQIPAVAIERVDGHFGLTKDTNGNLVEITNEVLKQGTDYTLDYPSPSKAVGSYTITVNFPSDANQYKYVSQKPTQYGLQYGIPYYLTSSANDHVIKYELNGGINHEDNPNLYQTGTEIVLKAPAKAGFVFGGWYTTEDFKDGSLIERIPATSTSEYTVYAKWVSEDEVAYKIQYVLNGGDNNVNNPIGYTGATDISLRPAKKAGHQFDGWFFDAEFTKSADTIVKGTTGNLKLYAKFTRLQDGKSYITTSVKGGSISNDVIANKGDKVVVSYKPNKGYVLNSVTVDGVKVDISKYPTSYTFENVDGDHTISVLFKVKLGKATLSGIKTGNGKIQVSWKAVNRAKEYKVYRSTNGKKYTLIGSTKELKYIDAGVKAGTKYYYKVAAYANGSFGAKSAAKNIKASKALTRAKLTSVVAKNGKVTAKWKKVKGAASYKLYRSADSGKTYKLVTTTKKTSFTTKNVQDAKWYRYKVVTVKNGIEGKMSAVKKVNVLAQTKGIKVSSKKKTVTVSWNKTKNAGKYEIYRSVNGGKTFKKVLTTKKTTSTFKKLKAGSKHQYKVRAVYGKSYGKFTAVKKITVKK